MFKQKSILKFLINIIFFKIFIPFRHFLLSDGINISIYSYEGRLVSTPKLSSSKPDSVNINTVSISPDTIAVRDATDTKCKLIRILAKNKFYFSFILAVMFFDINGKPIGDGKLVSHAVN